MVDQTKILGKRAREESDKVDDCRDYCLVDPEKTDPTAPSTKKLPQPTMFVKRL